MALVLPLMLLLPLTSVPAALAQVDIPVAVTPDDEALDAHTSDRFDWVVAGRRHTCASTGQRRLYCWGDNSSGQLGTGVAINQSVPTQVAVGEGFTQGGVMDFVAGESHTCAEQDTAVPIIANQMYCWGAAPGTAVPATPLVSYPKVVMPNEFWDPDSMSAGAGLTCATFNGNGYCWGQNGFGNGQTGTNAPTTYVPFPMKIALSASWNEVEAGYGHACGITWGSSGGIYCWGESSLDLRYFGQTYVGPQLVSSGSYADLVVGKSYMPHACVRSSSGVYCWGHNNNGQLGDGSSTTHRFTLGPVSGLPTVGQLFVGPDVTCALQNGAPYGLYCWGRTSYFGPSPTPTLVATDVRSVALGGEHMCLIYRTTRQLWCKGENGQGQVGDGTTTDRSSFVLVGGHVQTPPVLVSPQAGHVFAEGEPQQFMVRADQADHLYRAKVIVKNALTGVVAREFFTNISAKGVPAVVQPDPALAPGTYRWTAETSGTNWSRPPEQLIGVPSPTAVISGTCADNRTDGYVGPMYVRVRTASTPDATRVCLRADGGPASGAFAGGRLEVEGPATIENDVTACSATGGTVVPVVHTQVGDPADPSTYARVDGDIRTDATSVAVCMRVTYANGTLTAAALRVRSNTTSLPEVRFVPDVPGHAAPPPPAPAPGLASSACQSSPDGRRVLNLTVGSSRVALHTIETGDQVAVCARADGSAAGGGRLVLEPMGDDPVLSVDTAGADPGEPGHPCTLVVTNWTGVPDEVHVRRSATGLGENWLCVNVGGDGGFNAHVRLSTGGSTVPDAQWFPDA